MDQRFLLGPLLMRKTGFALRILRPFYETIMTKGPSGSPKISYGLYGLAPVAMCSLLLLGVVD
jgi:hypothetical protein